MRIAFITGGLQFGGSTVFLLRLGTGLRALGIPCSVFSWTAENPFAGDFAEAGIPVHVTDERRFIYEDRLIKLYSRIAEFSPTTALANIGQDAYELLSYLPGQVTRVGMIHDLAMNPERLIPMYEDVLNGIVVVNRHLVNLVSPVAPHIACRYLAHGIPLPKEPPKRTPDPAEPLKLLFYGRLAEGKGTRLFPAIVGELRERKIPFRWRIHGIGPDEPYLREHLAREIASGEVILSSQLSQSDLSLMIGNQDVFIMASDIEGGPLTLLEAMAHGVVPICNDIPCLAQEVIDPENGFCIQRDPKEYAEVIARLHYDRPLLARMSAAARRTISDAYSIEAMAERYVEFFRSIERQGSTIIWPKHIVPRPIRHSRPFDKLIQHSSIGRQARRIMKRWKSS